MSNDIIMPYGAFKGRMMHEIPSGYLKWIAENIDDEAICCAADDEFQHRDHYGTHWWED